jgi:hypothetical protein
MGLTSFTSDNHRLAEIREVATRRGDEGGVRVAVGVAEVEAAEKDDRGRDVRGQDGL